MPGRFGSRMIRISSLCVIFATSLLTYGYFRNEAGLNGRSRIALVRSLVEDGTTRIDRLHMHAGDISYFQGHYYTNKAPGASFLAVPAYAAFFALLKATLGEPDARAWVDRHAWRRGLYLSTVAAHAIPSALALTFFFLVATDLAGDRRRALFATAAYGFGSLAFPYSTIFFGHQLAAVLLFLSFGLLARERWRHHAMGVPWRRWPVALSGLAAGYAVVTEFPAAVPTLLIGLYLIWIVPKRRLISLYGLGVLLSGALLLIYNRASFGSFFAVGYSYLAIPGAELQAQGFLGVTYPKLSILVEILFGFSRGLLPLTPVLVLSPLGFHRMWRGKVLRPEGVLCAAVASSYLLFNASYFFWHGGSSLGPRFVVAMLPFLYLPIAFALGQKIALPGLLLLVSTAHMLAATAVDPVVPGTANTLFHYIYPRFLDTQLAIARGKANWGAAFGLHGWATLLPLLIVWVAASLFLITQQTRPGDRARDDGGGETSGRDRAPGHSGTAHRDPR